MAGRNNKQSVDYFPHYIKHGMKMDVIQQRFGNDGYATWYKIMERLGSTDYHHLNLSDDVAYMHIISYCNVDENTFNDIINMLVKMGWLHRELWNDARVLCSPKFIESISDAYKRRNNDCISTTEIELMYHINTQTKVDYTKLKEKRGAGTNGTIEKMEIVNAADFSEIVSTDDQYLLSFTSPPPNYIKSLVMLKNGQSSFSRHCVQQGKQTRSVKEHKAHLSNWAVKKWSKLAPATKLRYQ